MQFTMELAATASQVIPVFAVGSLVAYAAQVRSHNNYLRPYMLAIKEINSNVVRWDAEGIEGYELIKQGNRYIRENFGSHFEVDPWEIQRRLWAVVFFLLIIIANAVAFVLALLRLGNSTTPQHSAVFVVCAMVFGLAATALVPIVARSRGLGVMVAMFNDPSTKHAGEITKRARATMTDADREHEARFKSGTSESDEQATDKSD